ncbi:hypothetical protein KKG85_01840 [Patescibacteria group bacterium]|nr:hypothetical protein [Patescibacteria group bacterium]MBU2579879.1 hypothetical protein [Patescibacteria group bacterium]
MKTYQKILIGIIVGLIVFPTVTLGGSFVVSLIQGKTPAEAVQIIAEQMDILIGRVEVVETKQTEQEQTVSELQNIINQQANLILKEQSCNEARNYLLDRGYSGYQSILDEISHQLNEVARWQKNLDQATSEIQRIENDDITVIDPTHYWDPDFEQFEATKTELEILRSQRGSNMPIPFSNISSSEFENIPSGCYTNLTAECKGELYRHLELEKLYVSRKSQIEDQQSRLEEASEKVSEAISIKEQYLLLEQKCDSLSQ